MRFDTPADLQASVRFLPEGGELSLGKWRKGWWYTLLHFPFQRRLFPVVCYAENSIRSLDCAEN
jgi:hypothetical protein